MSRFLTRRELISWAAAAGLFQACGPAVSGPATTLKLPDQTPSRDPANAPVYADSVDALFDVLLPLEANSIGAREAGVDLVLETEHFARLAVAQGFVMPLPETTLEALDDLAVAARATLNAALDARAQVEKPLSKFSELDRETQENIVAAGFADDAQRPVLLVLRAACFTAYLGAVTSDAGLQEIGFPPFESFADGLASSGFADYSVNQPPVATVGDDLSAVLTPLGDLQ
jgi:hypothetical protein